MRIHLSLVTSKRDGLSQLSTTRSENWNKPTCETFRYACCFLEVPEVYEKHLDV